MRRCRADMENTKVWETSCKTSKTGLIILGTWVPLEQGEALAQRNHVYEKLSPIFQFIPGNLSPPPAPKHTTAKPKITKRPAVPKFNNSKHFVAGTKTQLTV